MHKCLGDNWYPWLTLNQHFIWNLHWCILNTILILDWPLINSWQSVAQFIMYRSTFHALSTKISPLLTDVWSSAGWPSIDGDVNKWWLTVHWGFLCILKQSCEDPVDNSTLYWRAILDKYLIVIHSLQAYLSHNQCAIMWVPNYRYPTWLKFS